MLDERVYYFYIPFIKLCYKIAVINRNDLKDYTVKNVVKKYYRVVSGS